MMQVTRRGLAPVLLALFVMTSCSLSGCCSIGLKNCTPVDSLVFVGDAKLNACGADDGSAPVNVSVYYLTDPEPFRSASALELSKNPESKLGGSLCGHPKTLTVLPNQSVPWENPRAPEATHIGIAASFCSSDGTWRALIPLDKSVRANVMLAGITLTVAPRK